ncbi:MAG: DUF861 domain-containing protein [Chloroflexi bacterium]|nr:DUF861 domain-containing protein [Chloroflexota bacterium]
MTRQLFTASDIRRLARDQKSDMLVVGPSDLVTPEAYDAAKEMGVRILREATPPKAEVDTKAAVVETVARIAKATGARLKSVRGQSVMLESFGAELATPGTNVRLKDVIGSTDGSPMGAGYMALDKGTFPWTLNYDEVDIVIDGELEIRRGDEVARAGPGDCIFVPKGSSITFGTPSRVRFFYVTFPADWQ